ncbi:MAG TPA: SRPBCC family protein, partial [Planctomycetota bacterium]|nr:SRPBCC family protein [Planctomycetota bacterium]
MLKQFALVFAGLIGLAFLISFVLPGRWDVSRNVPINADSYEIHAFVEDLENWTNWSPWGRAVDGSAKVTLGQDHRGVDGSMQWTGEKVGSGTLVVRSSDPERGLVFELGLRGGKELVRGYLSYEPAPNGGTVVHFRLDGDVSSSPTGRYIGLMRGYTTGPDLVDALTRLKRRLERGV